MSSLAPAKRGSQSGGVAPARRGSSGSSGAAAGGADARGDETAHFGVGVRIESSSALSTFKLSRESSRRSSVIVPAEARPTFSRSRSRRQRRSAPGVPPAEGWSAAVLPPPPTSHTQHKVRASSTESPVAEQYGDVPAARSQYGSVPATRVTTAVVPDAAAATSATSSGRRSARRRRVADMEASLATGSSTASSSMSMQSAGTLPDGVPPSLAFQYRHYWKPSYDRKAAEALLRTSPHSAALVRPHSRDPGNFVVSFRNTEGNGVTHMPIFHEGGMLTGKSAEGDKWFFETMDQVFTFLTIRPIPGKTRGSSRRRNGGSGIRRDGDGRDFARRQADGYDEVNRLPKDDGHSDNGSSSSDEEDNSTLIDIVLDDDDDDESSS